MPRLSKRSQGSPSPSAAPEPPSAWTVARSRSKKRAASDRLLVAGTRPNGSPESPPAAEFDLLVDPGAHVVLLTAPDGRERVSNRKVETGERTRWSLDLPDPKPTAKATRAVIVPPDEAPPEPASRRGWAAVAFGVGAAGFTVAAVSGLMALDEASELDEACAPDQGCPPGQKGTLDDFHLHTMLANIGFGVGLVGVGLGTYFWLSEPEQEGESPSARAFVGPASIGVRGRF